MSPVVSRLFKGLDLRLIQVVRAIMGKKTRANRRSGAKDNIPRQGHHQYGGNTRGGGGTSQGDAGASSGFQIPPIRSASRSCEISGGNRGRGGSGGGGGGEGKRGGGEPVAPGSHNRGNYVAASSGNSRSRNKNAAALPSLRVSPRHHSPKENQQQDGREACSQYVSHNDDDAKSHSSDAAATTATLMTQEDYERYGRTADLAIDVDELLPSAVTQQTRTPCCNVGVSATGLGVSQQPSSSGSGVSAGPGGTMVAAAAGDGRESVEQLDEGGEEKSPTLTDEELGLPHAEQVSRFSCFLLWPLIVHLRVVL